LRIGLVTPLTTPLGKEVFVLGGVAAGGGACWSVVWLRLAKHSKGKLARVKSINIDIRDFTFDLFANALLEAYKISTACRRKSRHVSETLPSSGESLDTFSPAQQQTLKKWVA
jgi:hypothetical protein